MNRRAYEKHMRKNRACTYTDCGDLSGSTAPKECQDCARDFASKYQRSAVEEREAERKRKAVEDFKTKSLSNLKQAERATFIIPESDTKSEYTIKGVTSSTAKPMSAKEIIKMMKK